MTYQGRIAGKGVFAAMFLLFGGMAGGGAAEVRLDLDAEIAAQFALLKTHIQSADVIEGRADQTLHPASLVTREDRDPLDIILRRTAALLEDLRPGLDAGVSTGFERELSGLRSRAGKADPASEEVRFALFAEAARLRRRIAFSNPLLDFDRLLFIKRHLSRFNHMADQYYGEYAAPGGGVYELRDPFGDEPRLRDIVGEAIVERGRLEGSQLEKTGSFLSPQISYDGVFIYFAYVELTGPRGHVRHLDHAERGHWHQGRCYHLFRIRADGTGLEQLTDGTWNDFDPHPLPNGRIVFVSERRGGYLRCGRACPSYTLFDMRPDGSDIRVLSPHENNEWHPSVTHDGMILYTRWDYVDRHGTSPHHPWIMFPDGRDSRAVHGNYAIRKYRPDMELSMRKVPGSHTFTGTAAPHHGQAFGSLILVDPRIPDDDRMAPVKRITPEVAFPESEENNWTLAYGTPWPLGERYYLCAYDASMPPKGEIRGYTRGDFGLYLVDAFGNRELIYRDPEIGSMNPIPLRPRKKPPVIPDRSQRLADAPPPDGTMAVMNVYDSQRPWPEGTRIKALRIYQVFPSSVPSGRPPHETGRRIAEAGDSINLARRILGTVPVEEDGSAHFRVPALKLLYFQALDEKGLAVTSMRSATWVQPGEQLTCLGCHEPRHQAPPAGGTRSPLALRRPPSVPAPDVDGTNPFSYPRLVQPVLDRHCVECHTAKAAEGAPLLDREIVAFRTGRGRTRVFRSYNSLIPHAFWRYADAYRTIPGRFGARASKLYGMLEKGHHDVRLPPADLHRITVWLDSVSNFYGVYEKEGGEAQLRGEIAHPTLE